MSKNIVFEGWLTKSPPMKRIWRTKWRRRWFALRQSGELPGQYFLDYYADRNCRRLKGTINLDLCEQVDAGLHMERNTHGTLDPKLRGSVFTIQTQSRTYHLEADCEADMMKWVDAICRVCGLRSTEDSPEPVVTYQNSVPTVAVVNEQYDRGDSASPYIPISECITGVRSQDSQRPLKFDSRNIVISPRTPLKRAAGTQMMYTSQPQIRPPNNYVEFSENDSNLSEDECKSLNASQPSIRGWSVGKSFTKSSASPNQLTETGPPVPPRPPKTLAMSKECAQQESDWERHERTSSWEPSPQRAVTTAPSSPRRHKHTVRFADEQPANVDHLAPSGLVKERAQRGSGILRLHGARVSVSAATRRYPSLQYCNLTIIPPMVDRNLKPRYTNYNIMNDCYRPSQGIVPTFRRRDFKSDVLQYLDLDLHTSHSRPDKLQDMSKRHTDIYHGNSLSAEDTDPPYKTVDFLKTEAFNITRQDAEASRSNQH